MWIAVIIFVFLSLEIINYLTGEQQTEESL
jgi:hypothetical protein